MRESISQTDDLSQTGNSAIVVIEELCLVSRQYQHTYELLLQDCALPVQVRGSTDPSPDPPTRLYVFNSFVYHSRDAGDATNRRTTLSDRKAAVHRESIGRYCITNAYTRNVIDSDVDRAFTCQICFDFIVLPRNAARSATAAVSGKSKTTPVR